MAIVESDFLALTQDLDPAAFWEENKLCRGFTTDKPRCAASFSPDDHWLFEFLGVTDTVRYYQDKPFRDNLHREANTVLRAHVGIAPFSQDTWTHQPKRIENLFGCEFSYHSGGTPWFIHGHLPPFLLRNCSAEAIRQRIIDDFRKAGATGGMEITTAGSLAGGTGVGRMRWFMKCVQECCGYDG